MRAEYGLFFVTCGITIPYGIAVHRCLHSQTPRCPCCSNFLYIISREKNKLQVGKNTARPWHLQVNVPPVSLIVHAPDVASSSCSMFRVPLYCIVVERCKISRLGVIRAYRSSWSSSTPARAAGCPAASSASPWLSSSA